MKINVYAIFDSCSGTYQNPITALADGEIVRSFGDIAQDATHPIGQHPEHYSLWRLGVYDNQNATIKAETKECISTALEVLAMTQNPNRAQLDLLQDEVDFMEPDKKASLNSLDK